MNTEDEKIFHLAEKLLKNAKYLQRSSPSYLMMYIKSIDPSDLEDIKKHGEKLSSVISYYEESFSAPTPMLLSISATCISFVIFLAGYGVKGNPDGFEKLAESAFFLSLFTVFLVFFARHHISRASVVKYAISFLMEKQQH